MTKLESRKADYFVMVLHAYAREYQLEPREAFARLDGCGAIDALDELYDIEHTLPVSMTVADLEAMYERSVA